MATRTFMTALTGVLAILCANASSAARDECPAGTSPSVSFVQFLSPNLSGPTPLTLKGKFTLPTGESGDRPLCIPQQRDRPAVLILHGSAGIDARGDFYAEALNKAGFATLQIDMWEARGVTSPQTRPQAPILTFPDAFSALGFLENHPNVIPGRIGVFGVSWGGVVSLAAAEQAYVGMFGEGRTFAAHVAHYPVCWAANTAIPGLPPPAQFGTRFLTLTGAPVLIQVGSEDDYDNGAGPCRALADTVNPTNNGSVQVTEYPGAYHAWDRLMVPIAGPDPFGNQGSYFFTGQLPIVELVPDVQLAYEARERVVRFFRRHLK